MTKRVTSNPKSSFETHLERGLPLRSVPGKRSDAYGRKKTVRAAAHPSSIHLLIDDDLVGSNRIADDLIAVIERKHGAWSASELAELLGCSGKHIYALAETGRMPHLRIGGMIRFDPRITAAWLRERSVAA
jgi:excisionase family DNA binding protein